MTEFFRWLVGKDYRQEAEQINRQIDRKEVDKSLTTLVGSVVVQSQTASQYERAVGKLTRELIYRRLP